LTVRYTASRFDAQFGEITSAIRLFCHGRAPRDDRGYGRATAARSDSHPGSHLERDTSHLSCGARQLGGPLRQ